jgi:hypothetical protein
LQARPAEKGLHGKKGVKSSVVQRFFTFGDLREDSLYRRTPDEGPRILVVILQIFINGRNQCRNTPEGATTESPFGDFTEPFLHRVPPGTGSRNKVNVESGMPRQPGLKARMFVSSVVVHDQVHIQLWWSFEIDRFEEADKLLMTMPCMQSPMTRPSRVTSAANSVVVPFRL